MRNRIAFLVSFFFLASVVWGRSSGNAQSNSQTMPGMDMRPAARHVEHERHAHGDDKDADKDSDASAHAMHSMEGHMDMGPHMKMTALRRQTGRRRASRESRGSRAQGFGKIHWTITLRLADGFRFSILKFRRRCITSPTTDRRSKRIRFQSRASDFAAL